ncbi:DUF1003 domain-containing protein [Calidifontibacter terrae]
MSERTTRSSRDGGRLDQPRELRGRFLPRIGHDNDRFGILSERFARWMGTAQFLIWMTIFVVVYVGWNVLAPVKFDPYSFTFLTLVLSLQASYAAPLILLAQNRQDDRDRVALDADRQRDERNLADTEFITREVASLRLALRETATRDFVRSELRNLLDELEDRGLVSATSTDTRKGKKKPKNDKSASAERASDSNEPTPPASD